MEKKRINNKEFKRVLVFNPVKRCIAVFHSLTAAARAFDVSVVSIGFACSGETISIHGLYFRYASELVDLSVLGEMSLLDWDKAHGLKMKYYPTAAMSRKGMKYNKAK